MEMVAVTDPMQVGSARQAMIGNRCTGDTTRVAEKLAATPAVDYVVRPPARMRRHREVVCEARRRPPTYSTPKSAHFRE